MLKLPELDSICGWLNGYGIYILHWFEPETDNVLEYNLQTDSTKIVHLIRQWKSEKSLHRANASYLLKGYLLDFAPEFAGLWVDSFIAISFHQSLWNCISKQDSYGIKQIQRSLSSLYKDSVVTECLDIWSAVFGLKSVAKRVSSAPQTGKPIPKLRVVFKKRNKKFLNHKQQALEVIRSWCQQVMGTGLESLVQQVEGIITDILQTISRLSPRSESDLARSEHLLRGQVSRWEALKHDLLRRSKAQKVSVQIQQVLRDINSYIENQIQFWGENAGVEEARSILMERLHKYQNASPQVQLQGFVQEYNNIHVLVDSIVSFHRDKKAFLWAVKNHDENTIEALTQKIETGLQRQWYRIFSKIVKLKKQHPIIEFDETELETELCQLEVVERLNQLQHYEQTLNQLGQIESTLPTDEELQVFIKQQLQDLAIHHLPLIEQIVSLINALDKVVTLWKLHQFYLGLRKKFPDVPRFYMLKQPESLSDAWQDGLQKWQVQLQSKSDFLQLRRSFSQANPNDTEKIFVGLKQHPFVVEHGLNLYCDPLFTTKRLNINGQQFMFIRIQMESYDIWVATEQVTIQQYQMLFDNPFYRSKQYDRSKPMDSIPLSACLLFCNQLSESYGVRVAYPDLIGKDDLCLLSKSKLAKVKCDESTSGFRLLLEDEWRQLQSLPIKSYSRQAVEVLSTIGREISEWGWSATALQEKSAVCFGVDSSSSNANVVHHNLGMKSPSIGFRLVFSVASV